MKSIPFFLALLIFSSVYSDTLKVSDKSVSVSDTNISAPISDSIYTSQHFEDMENPDSSISEFFSDSSSDLPPDNDSSYHSTADTVQDTSASSLDSSADIQSISSDSGENVMAAESPPDLTIPPVISPETSDGLDEDTLSLTGWHLGFGIGLSLGSLPVLKLWEKSLPLSLESFGLEPQSFIRTDTSSDTLSFGDTSLLAFTEIEAPTIYNITFPLMVSIIRFRENDRFISSLGFSHISKQQKTTVFSRDDTTGSRVDIRNKLRFYSLTIDLTYSLQIPPEYFSINEFDRTGFFIGCGVSPLVSVSTIYKTDSHFDRQNERMIDIEKSIVERSGSFTCYGLSAFLKAGISTVRRLTARQSMEISVSWSLNKYDYFRSNGNDVLKKEINHGHEDNTKLSFLSNRLDISFSLLRRLKNKQDK